MTKPTTNTVKKRNAQATPAIALPKLLSRKIRQILIKFHRLPSAGLVLSSKTFISQNQTDSHQIPSHPSWPRSGNALSGR
ncbi:MAG: hypothetical protein E6I91_00865 [Chloroflexi bacterium]|nr:MAG: hypothetical protein E6I91_00865 [Chloroflexota bacterium]